MRGSSLIKYVINTYREIFENVYLISQTNEYTIVIVILCKYFILKIYNPYFYTYTFKVVLYQCTKYLHLTTKGQ